MVGVVVEALGAFVSIDINGLTPTDRAHVGALWAGAAVCGHSETRFDRTVELRPAFEFRTMLAHLSGQVTVAAMSARRGDAWLLHAAAAADGAGRVVALVGPSGAGKTTAIRTLARHYGYVSDESIAVEADGAVRAYRKPLSIVEAGTREKLQVSPAQAGLRSLPETPLRLAGLVVLDRRVDPTSPRLERLEPPSALAALAAQSSHAREMGRPLATMAGHLAVTGGAHRLVYSDAADLPEAIAPLFREPSGTPDTQDWDSVPALTGGGALRRSDVIDAIRYADGRVAILCDGARERDPLALHVLSADAGAAWWHPESHEESRDGDLISALVHHGLLARREE